MTDYSPAPIRHKVFNKLPINRETAAAMVDIYIVPMLERAGLTVKVTKSKTARTLQIKLPTK